jgi:hypothetical protein
MANMNGENITSADYAGFARYINMDLSAQLRHSSAV